MGDKMKQWLRRVLLVVGVVCLGVALYRAVESAGGTEAYDQAEEIAFQQDRTDGPEDATLPVQTTQPEQPKILWVPEPVTEEDKHITKLQEIDLDALREVNPDVIGWILVPNTHINYPIMQGEDNDFYLNHTWKKVKNAVGSIFMEYRNYPDFADFNTILYGHNMNNNSMFGDLDKYRGTWYTSQNPYVYIVNDEGIFRYQIFSYHRAPVDSFVYGVSFNQRETRENFITSALEAAEDDLGIVPEFSDRILTLSTCTGSTHEKRFVVHAVLKMIPVEAEE